jgi:FkbM family methyltransferase
MRLPGMFIALTYKQCLKYVPAWLSSLAKRSVGLMMGSTTRFVIITPPFLKRQLVYDARQRRLINCEVRDLTDYRILRQIFLHHDYDIEKSARADDIRRAYRAIIESGKTPLIVDCGGHIGLGTRYFCETYKEAFVVCIEPNESNLDVAKKNNRPGRADLLLAGVGSSRSRGSLQDPGIGSWGYRIEDSENGSIDVLTIEDVLKRYDPSQFSPFIIKIDIEGYESNLFADHTDWMDLFPMIVIELHDWMFPGQANSRNFLYQVSARNRDFVFDRENVFTVSNAI